MIPLKSDKDLDAMRKAGAILAGIMRDLRKIVKPGVSTAEIDKFAEELLLRGNVMPAFKGYRGFPATICTSVNEEIVHGIPGGRVLLEGDIIGLDLGLLYEGYYSDSAVTLPVGQIDKKKKKLIEVTRNALWEGVKQARVDNHLFDISSAIQNYVEKNGFSVVRQFVGHGIGKDLHEEPEIPNFGRSGCGPLLKKGMVLAIEPMVNMGGWQAVLMDNGWTAVTKDGSPSAHFEHTIAVSEKSAEILTN